MSFHVAAYTELLDNVANNDITALADQILAIQNNHFLPQYDYRLLAAWVGSATLLRARIVNPSVRQLTIPFIRPITLAAVPPTDPNIADYRSNPFLIRAMEELAIEATSGVAMTERFTALVWLSRQIEAAPPGDVYTLRGTGATTLVVNAWTDIATVTWADNLPAGEYAIIGCEVQSAGCIAARLILENQIERPGCLGITALGNRTHDMFRKGGLGKWGTFRQTRMPIVQVLSNSADTTEEIYLDLVKVR